MKQYKSVIHCPKIFCAIKTGCVAPFGCTGDLATRMLTKLSLKQKCIVVMLRFESAISVILKHCYRARLSSN